MRVTATPRAEAVIRKVADSGREDLVLVLGTGCCDSTAPSLYDRYYPGPDVMRVGEAACSWTWTKASSTIPSPSRASTTTASFSVTHADQSG